MECLVYKKIMLGKLINDSYGRNTHKVPDVISNKWIKNIFKYKWWLLQKECIDITLTTHYLNNKLY